MKKGLLIIFVLLFFQIGLSIPKGLIFQVNSSYLLMNSQYSMPKLLGGVGFYFKIPIKNNLFLLNEITINNYGALYKDYVYDIENLSNYNLRYLDVPILLSYQPHSNYYINFGPVIGFNLKKQLSTKVGNLKQIITLNNFDQSNLSFALGIGIDFPNFGFEFRFYRGVLPISSDNIHNVKTAMVSIIAKLTFN